MSHGDEFRKLSEFAVNKLPEADYQFASEQGSWTVSAGNATITVDADIKPYSGGYNSLKLTPSDTSDFTIECNTVDSSYSDQRDDIVLHALVKSDATCVATIAITNSQGLTNTSRSVAVPANRWFVIRSEGIDIPQSTLEYELSFSITFSDHTASTPIYFAYPTVMADFAFMDNMFVRQCAPLLPEVLVTKDSEQTFPSFPMFRLLDVGATYSGLAYEQFDHFRYLDLEGGKDANDEETLSGLVNVATAEEEYLPWLSQFAGVKLAGAKAGTTPWENLVGAGTLTTWSDVMSEADDDGFDAIDITSIASVAGGDVTVTVASSNWPSPAPEVEQTIIIAGTTSFDGQYEINAVNAGSYQMTYNDGVEWGSLTRDASGDVVGYIKSDSDSKYLDYIPNWAEVGTNITISGVTDTSFNGTFAITDINRSAATIYWNDGGSASAVVTEEGYGAYVTSESTGQVTQVDSAWLDLELYDLAAASLGAFYRDQITHAYNGYKAGSYTSLEMAAKQFLRDTQTVQITKRYGGDEWAILVETLTSETPNGVDDTEAEVVVDQIAISKPVGYVVTHLCRATL